MVQNPYLKVHDIVCRWKSNVSWNYLNLIYLPEIVRVIKHTPHQSYIAYIAMWHVHSCNCTPVTTLLI